MTAPAKIDIAASHRTRYSFTTYQDGKDFSYQVIGDNFRLLEGGYGRSRRDAAECARDAIRQLEAGNHFTQVQQVAA